MHTPAGTTDCCGGNGLISVEAARRRILQAVHPISGTEILDIRSALGRVLDETVISRLDIPPYRNSAMDGYAVRGTDLPARGSTTLRVIGQSMAGAPFDGSVEDGTCVRIMTGAVLPPGADTVVMQESVRREGDDATIGTGHRAGENVRHPGEDIRQGEPVLAAGKRLMPADIGVLASVGVARVRARRRLRAAFFSTGDELRAVGEPLGPGQIYDSNRYTMDSMLARLDIDRVDLGVIPDDRQATEAAFLEAAGEADVILTSGGVSVGEADYVKETLDRLGKVDFWRIAMKPGKPVAFGMVNDAVFFGLPGNPVSVMATFYQFVQPALETMMGLPPRQAFTLKARTATALKKAPGRTEFQRGVLTRDADGELSVTGSGGQGSHILTSMSRADCFIILPAENAGVAAGELVDVQPFSGLI